MAGGLGTATGLTGSSLLAWIALRRTCRGGLAKLGERYLDQGRLVPGYLGATLDTLAGAGLVTLGVADPEAGGLRRVRVTEAGWVEYVALCVRAAGSIR